MSAGEQMFLGIKLHLDASGVVSGASLASSSLAQVKNASKNTAASMSTGLEGAATQAFRVAAAMGAVGMAAKKVGNMIQGQFLDPAIEQAKSYEVEMSQLRFVTDATAQEMERLHGVAIKTGVETQFSPQDSAKGLRMLKAAGLETEVAIKSLGATLDVVIGSAGTISLQEGATATAAAFLKFRHTTEDARQIMDSYAEATRNTNLQLGDMRRVMNSMRDAPSKLKMGSNVAFGMVGILRSAGMMANQAGQQMTMFANRFIMTQGRVERYLRKKGITEEQLFDPTYFDKKMPDAVHHFKQLGVHMFKANGEIRKSEEFLMDLTQRATELDKESQKAFLTTSQSILGPRSSSVLTALMSYKKGGVQGAQALKLLFDTIKNGAGASREAGEAIEQTVAGMEKFIEGSKETISILGGSMFLPIMKKFYGIVREVVNAFLYYMKVNPEFTKALMITIGIIVVAIQVFAVLSLAIAGAYLWMKWLGPALFRAGGFLGIFAEGLVMVQAAIWPMFLALVAIVGVFLVIRGAMYAFKKGLESNIAGPAKAIIWLIDSMKMAFEAIGTFLDRGGISNKLKEQLESRELLGFVVTIVQLRTKFLALWDGIKEGLGAVLKPLWEAAKMVWRWLGAVVTVITKLVLGWEQTNIAGQLPLWKSLGKVIGWVGAIFFTKFVLRVIHAAIVVLPRLIVSLVVTIAKFFLLGVRIIFTSTVALVGFIRKVLWTAIFALPKLIVGIVVAAARFVVLGVVAMVTAWKITLIVLAIVAYVAIIGVAIYAGGKLGESMAGWIHTALTSLLILWEEFKNWGGKISDVFVQAFKGNFEPLFTYLKDAIAFAEAALGRVFGDTTEKQFDAAAAKLGLGVVTDKDKEKAGTDAAAYQRGASPTQFATPAEIQQRIRMKSDAYRNKSAEQRRREADPVIQGIAQGTAKNVRVDKIELIAKNNTPEEAARLAVEIMGQVAILEDDNAETEFI